MTVYQRYTDGVNNKFEIFFIRWYTMRHMSEGKPIPVRLSEDLIKQLDRVTNDVHLGTRTDLIKLCLVSFLDYFEKNKEAKLPLDWKEMLDDLDGRK